MKPSDVGQQIHSYKQGSYKWDLVRFNHTSHEIIMMNIRDDLECMLYWKQKKPRFLWIQALISRKKIFTTHRK